jgi:hypothetical protein
MEIHFHGPVKVTVGAGSAIPQVTASRDAGGLKGADIQSRAMKLVEQGNYSQAVAEYQAAIAAYQSDISAGRNVDFARRGIVSCQTGIKICNQGQ